MNDCITIREMEIQCRIGVPDEERATPQKLAVTVSMSIDTAAAAQSDDIEHTIDYYSVYQQIHTLAAAKPRRLIETLAEEIAEMVIAEFAVKTVNVQIDKFILPKTRCVSIEISRP